MDAKGLLVLKRTFTAYGDAELHCVEQFKYLGHILAYNNNNAPVIQWNLKRARQVWGRIFKVIVKDSVPTPVAGMF